MRAICATVALATLTPATCTVPSLGRNRPMSSLVSVVLPAPFSPTRAVTPGSNAIVKPGSGYTSAPPAYAKRTASKAISANAAPSERRDRRGERHGQRSGKGGLPREPREHRHPRTLLDVLAVEDVGGRAVGEHPPARH